MRGSRRVRFRRAKGSTPDVLALPEGVVVRPLKAPDGIIPLTRANRRLLGQRGPRRVWRGPPDTIVRAGNRETREARISRRALGIGRSRPAGPWRAA